MTTATLTRPTETQRVLAEMLVENTGRHMLDSGGAYGRNWERNQGKTVEDFMAAPAISLDSFESVEIDVFHWLDERLEYDPRMDRMFQVFTLMYSDDNTAYLTDMETFAEIYQQRYSVRTSVDTVNSYNHESLLSQVIQFTLVKGDGEMYVLLQIHGGCDVRGGYTAPRAFRVLDGEGYEITDFDLFTAHCTRTEPEGQDPLPGMPDAADHWLDHRNGEWSDYNGYCYTDPWQERGLDFTVVDPETNEHYIQCPYCQSKMDLYPYPVG